MGGNNLKQFTENNLHVKVVKGIRNMSGVTWSSRLVVVLLKYHFHSLLDKSWVCKHIKSPYSVQLAQVGPVLNSRICISIVDSTLKSIWNEMGT